MGTDIHWAIEYRTDEGWRYFLDGLNLSHRMHSRIFDALLPGDRNYNFFGMLANVRNGVGFAGVVTGDGFDPCVPEPRLPNDLSFGARQYIEEGYLGEHNLGAVTSSHLREYWEKHKRLETRHRGVIEISEYPAFITSGRKRPKSYCGGISGGGTRVVTEAELKRHEWSVIGDHIASPAPEGATHVDVEWTSTYEESVGWSTAQFLSYGIEYLESDTHRELRFLFGFDS